MTALARLTTGLAAAVLALTGLGASPALAEPGPTLDDNGGLNQVIDPNQAQATDRVEIAAGHIDIGPTLNTGEWRVQIHDDTSTPRYWRMPSDVVLRVSDASQLTVPDDDAYAFLGVAPGTEVHVVPQTQQQDVVWTGWNTQEPNVLEQVDLGVTMSIVGFEGPGDLSLFLQSGNFGAPQVLYNTREPLPQQTWIELNTHTHANWVFTAPGEYLVELQFDADLRDGSHVSARDTIRYAVGDAASADALYDRELDPAAIASGADADGAASDVAAAGSSDDGSSTLLWIVVAVVAAALIAGLVVITLATARMKRQVRAARAGTDAGATGAASAGAAAGDGSPRGAVAPDTAAPGTAATDAAAPDTAAPNTAAPNAASPAADTDAEPGQ